MNNTKRLLALEQEREGLVAIADAFANADPEAATPEKEADARAAIERINAIDATMATIQATQSLRRTSPAVSSQAVSNPTGEEAGGVVAGQSPEDKILDDPMFGFQDAAHYALSIMNATVHTNNPSPSYSTQLDAFDRAVELMAAPPTGNHIEVGGSEGRAVPPQMRQEIESIIFAEDDILGMVNPEPTTSNSVEFLADETTPWGSTGIQAAWGAEAAQLAASSLDTDSRKVVLHKMHAYVSASDELLTDYPRLSRRLTEGAGRALQWVGSEAIVNGTGSGSPLGFGGPSSNYGGVIEIAKESGQTADTVVAENVLKMLSRFLRQPGARPVFLANSDTIPSMAVMSVGNEPSWMSQERGLSKPIGSTIFGIPLVYSEHCETVGDAGDVYLVDMAAYYAIVKSGGPKFASSIHLFFDYDVEAFRWTQRLGGMPKLAAAVTPNNGSTKSPFLRIAARA